eukprot:950404-Alexandrium_andersonii.AAC.1
MTPRCARTMRAAGLGSRPSSGRSMRRCESCRRSTARPGCLGRGRRRATSSCGRGGSLRRRS